MPTVRAARMAMIATAAVLLAANVVPSGLLRPGFVSERGWPLRWWHVCDVCGADGGYRYWGRLALDILVGCAIALLAGFLAEGAVCRRGRTGKMATAAGAGEEGRN